MIRAAIVAVVLGAATIASAHPAVSVAIDARGNVYYSDLEQVWRVTPNGAKSVVVPHVHTHQLYLDARGNLFGEHLWYEGERTDKWGHYVWQRTPDGRVTKIIPPTEGFLRDYSFVRDATGAMYWADEGIVKKTTADRKTTSIVARGFRNIRWMHATPAGTLYFIDAGDLVQIKNGRVRVMARKLASTSALRFQVPMQHAIMGVWTDRAENVYLADYAHGQVLRVSQTGRKSIVAQSTWPWSPCGGAFAANGRLWLLETSVTNSVRIRSVTVP